MELVPIIDDLHPFCICVCWVVIHVSNSSVDGSLGKIIVLKLFVGVVIRINASLDQCIPVYLHIVLPITYHFGRCCAHPRGQVNCGVSKDARELPIKEKIVLVFVAIHYLTVVEVTMSETPAEIRRGLSVYDVFVCPQFKDAVDTLYGVFLHKWLIGRLFQYFFRSLPRILVHSFLSKKVAATTAVCKIPVFQKEFIEK